MGLALYRRGFKLPTDKNRLSGAGHIQFEVFFHWETSWIEVEGLVRILKKEFLKAYVRKKAAFCQEKNGL
jgi:hypothetical protein